MRLLPTLSLLLGLSACLGAARAEGIRVLIQNSPLAGSQYYAVGEQWESLQVGDRLELIREPDNRHDRHAIRVEWHGRQLGYVPRAGNRALAAALDAGDRLVGRIAALSRHPDPWRRVRFEVFVEL
ncbi:MAG TPA: HIRAN domain-containing protein [Azonexus sp.]